MLAISKGIIKYECVNVKYNYLIYIQLLTVIITGRYEGGVPLGRTSCKAPELETPGRRLAQQSGRSWF